MADDQNFPVVGIGASAGGIEALQGFFSSLPPESGLSFVVVTHLPTGRVSLLQDILSRYTTMPVGEINNDDPLKPDQVYVMPGGTVVTANSGKLRLREDNAQHHERDPINLFFCSLAEEFGERSVGIVLSGGGSDGALGIKSIKEHGGLTLAQGVDTSAPRHSGMPDSAIATGLVDLILPVEQMGPKLLEYARRFRALREADGDAIGKERMLSATREICEILKKQVGHEFSGYKEKTFLRRVYRRMQVTQQEGIEDYVSLLRKETKEVLELFRDLLIGVTSFFRDKDAFDVLEKSVLPKVMEGKESTDIVRIWVPGCATGEEVYSIAILVSEQLDKFAFTPKIQIFATDIDNASLAVARIGRYPIGLLKAVSRERLARFFTGEGDTRTVRKEVRDLCIFSSHSLLRDPPYSRIDLISCRNLLIYLDTNTQGRVITVLHYALKPGGFLLLGSSETVARYGELFTPTDKKNRIFVRRNGNSTAALPMLLAQASRPTPLVETTRSPLRQNVESVVLERFAPPHVIVNREGDVLYYSARTGKYLEAAPGSPNRQLLAMARKGLRLELRTALREAMETRRRVTRERIEVEIEDRIQLISLTLEPLVDRGQEPLYLVLFTDLGAPFKPAEGALSSGLIRDDRQDVEHLEGDLRETRERLQSTVEEYETSLEELKSANEEMVSVNEELQSTNEELETSKEEIHSINEELQTVNQELNLKVDELDRSNTDLKNLFDSTQIGTVFLDSNLLIRSYTSAVTSIFNLIPSDRGRPLTDIAGQIDTGELTNEIKQVLHGAGSRERRVTSADKKSYLVGLRPYRTTDERVNGIVLTFLDVTSLVRAEEHQRALVAELNHRVKNMLTVVLSLVVQILAKNKNPEQFAEAFIDRLHALARTYELLSNENWSEVSLRTVVQQELRPFAEKRISIEGPGVMLQPKPALSFGMVLHELVTNAVKYGALAGEEGQVKVRWNVSDGHLLMDWRETGGPAVKRPEHRGFGSELIEQEVSYGLDGHLKFKFDKGGLKVDIDIPVESGIRFTGVSV